MDGNPGTGKTTTLCKIFKIRPLMDGNEDTKKDIETELLQFDEIKNKINIIFRYS